MTWQPIETAPKDGTPVRLAWFDVLGSRHEGVARYVARYSREVGGFWRLHGNIGIVTQPHAWKPE